MNTNKIIGLLGTGIFLCLTLQGISSLVLKILEEVLLFSNLSPLLIYGLSQYATLVIVLIIFVYAVKQTKKLDFDQPQMIKKVFWTSVITYIITQVLGFAYPFVSILYHTEQYFDLRETYNIGLREHDVFQNLTIEISAWILKYTIIVILILKEIKADHNHTYTDKSNI